MVLTRSKKSPIAGARRRNARIVALVTIVGQ
jgi:hypothetical protein